MYTIGKKIAKYNDKTNGEKFKFTLDVSSTFTDVMTLQLFNVIKSVIYDGSTQNGVSFTPFAINTVENIVTANIPTVGLLSNNHFRYREPLAAKNLVVSTPHEQNLSYRDLFNMISAGQCLQLSRITVTSTLRSQLTNGILNVVNVSNIGELKRQSIPLITFFDATQNQNNILDVFINTEINKNQGLEFTIQPLSTATINFYFEV
jgi:hypothetical protein